MNYLIVKGTNNATPESFQLTSTIDKPRIVVNGSYIPLTTNPRADNCNIKISRGDKTYYAMRTSTSSYSQSASASATFNTTANVSAGLSNTTALTRASTYATLTRASTSATYTRASTSATLTRASTSATLTRASTYETLTRASTYATNYGTATSVTSIRMKFETVSERWNYYTSITYSWIWDNYYNSTNLYTYWPIATSMTAGSQSAAFNYDATISAPGHPIYATLYDDSYRYSQYNTLFVPWQMLVRASWWGAVKTTATIYLTQESIYGYNTRQSISGYATRESVSGYATRESVSGYGTRESVSGYGTRSSISGYSGVSSSSSSSSESASGTCWR